ncbi:hypothetical protein MBAV_006401, partial [Candidatus Magnetobacterium bavaricum]
SLVETVNSIIRPFLDASRELTIGQVIEQIVAITLLRLSNFQIFYSLASIPYSESPRTSAPDVQLSHAGQVLWHHCSLYP